MAVPEDIRSVPRPVNTVVHDSGKNGPKRYAVRERSRVKYVRGGNPQPGNGKVIGHIIDHKFVPVTPKSAKTSAGPAQATPPPPPAAMPDMVSYGASALVKSVVSDIFHDLLAVYPVNEAFSIMSMATLKVVKPAAPTSRMSTNYKRTSVCMDYPGAAMSKNTLGNLIQRLGMDRWKRQAFFKRRIEKVAADHHVVIDGTLKQDTSVVNDLSAFSYKSRTKGRREIPVLYAYDLELMEPVCAQVFPGNQTDASSYPAFIRDNDIRRGVIVADKGFPPSKIQAESDARPELHFITPIKRNDTRIAANGMFAYDGVLNGVDGQVLYKKTRIKGGRYLYSFKDLHTAAMEESDYIARAKEGGSLDMPQYEAKRRTFGLLVLESDQDLPPLTVYQCYEERWMIELVFRHYKNDEFMDKTGAQGDFSVIGNEFINYISTVATCRIVRKARQCGLLEKMSYGELMDDLASAWRRVDAPSPARSDDGFWVHTLQYVFKEMEALGLSIPAPSTAQDKPEKKRPRGRPRKDA